MDKNILKKFAIESRQDLMEKIKNKINTFYIDEDFKNEQKGELYILSNEKHSLSLTNDEFKKRELLIKRINELSLEQVIEEAAYTWFNRIIAIRYMEINDMLPLTRDNQSLGIRVLSSKDNTPDPEILKFTNLMNPDLDIDLKKEKYAELKDDNEKFKYILLLVCKKLGRAIPQVFDGITDYIDILIPDNLLNDTGFITKVINEVPEDNYNQVEIIGWLYQYYNQAEKDRVMANKSPYKKEEIPYATQMFTPDWIVKYLVENSICNKVKLDEKFICENFKYYCKNENNINNEYVNIEQLKILDPCCGSGHILVYTIEVLYKIYLHLGYLKNNIIENILEKNIYGLDIDNRAEQLSVLSVMLKAKEYDNDIFKKKVNLNIIGIKESNNLNEEIISSVKSREIFNYVKKSFIDAKEYGSILNIESKEYNNEINTIINLQNTIFKELMIQEYIPILRQAIILSNHYDIVVTNPPYNAKFNLKLKKYLEKYYPISKTDMFSIFMQKGLDLLNKDGILAMINQHSWMFLQSFEELRKYLISNTKFINMIHLGANAFGQGDVGTIVQTVAFVMNKTDKRQQTKFVRLTDYNTSREKEIKYLEKIKENIYFVDISNFDLLPGKVFAYWLRNKYVKLFKKPLISKYFNSKAGIVTGNDEYFLKVWFEIDYQKIRFKEEKYEHILEQKWVPMNKGGLFRKYFGNNDYVMNIYDLWDNNKTSKSVRRGDVDSYFKEGITWSMVSGNNPSYRLSNNKVYGVAAPAIFCDDKDITLYCLGFINCKISKILNEALNPTVNVLTGNIMSLPFIYDCNIKDNIIELVKENILICENDWNLFETSWDFSLHPLLLEQTLSSQKIKQEENNGFSVENTLEETYKHWEISCNERFNKLKQNEEELNRIFIDIYGLQDELTPEVEDKDITIRKADKEREIKSLISYEVGCMFGRYSLDKDGLIFAGGDFDKVYKHYKEQDGGWAGASLSDYKYLKDGDNEIELLFSPDVDNIIPITDEAYFGDDIVERFKTFIKVAYGDNTFNENMDFIAEALGKKGTETSEDTIRRYFVNDFFNNHIKIYQKRPIYWLFDSGKKNGFKALVYMHRYNENLIPKVRLDYLHRIQTTYEKLLSDTNYKLTTELSMSDKKAAQNRQADLNAKLQEIKEYDEKIAHIANQRISIDLDDGVKVNYDKFKDILAKIK